MPSVVTIIVAWLLRSLILPPTTKYQCRLPMHPGNVWRIVINVLAELDGNKIYRLYNDLT
jgi:hypothetical protein